MSVARSRLISCARLVVLAAVAAACLAFSGVAQAAAPPDPNTVGATTLSHVELNGVLGTERGVAPGQDVKIKANWEDNNSGCPTCLDEVATAFAGNPAAGCIESEGRGGFHIDSGTGEVDLGPAPKAPGTYNVVAQFEEQVTCAPAWNASASTGYQVVARVCTGFSATQALPPATRGTAYKAELTACDGVPPYKWKKTGKLPKGLKLSHTGLISGTPSTKLAAGSYPVAVKVTDSKKASATATLMLKVN